MSRPTPVPEVVITPTIYADSDTGVNVVNIVIGIKVGEYSNGFAVLDEPGDLYILRNAIDDYIKNNHIIEPVQ